MGKGKTRKLWTRISGRAPAGVSRAEFWGTLRRSIKDGDYELPDGWDVTIRWKNKEDKPWKSDDWATAMQESAESSRGWDKAILWKISREINRLPERQSVGPVMAAKRKKEVFARRSKAARKGWRTRRARARKGRRNA